MFTSARKEVSLVAIVDFKSMYLVEKITLLRLKRFSLLLRLHIVLLLLELVLVAMQTWGN